MHVKRGLAGTPAGAMGAPLPVNMCIESTKFKFVTTSELACAFEHHKHLISTMKLCEHPRVPNCPSGPPVYETGFNRWG